MIYQWLSYTPYNVTMGGAIVILDSDYYKKKMTEHLNSLTYKRLESNPVNEFKGETDNLLKLALEANWITKNEFGFLTNQFPVTPIIYSLPNIHKHPTEPPLRPIVSGTFIKICGLHFKRLC